MKTHEKTAELHMQLIAESGYEATACYRVSPAQWGDVLKVCEGDLTWDVLRERDLLRAALEKIVGESDRVKLKKMRELLKCLEPDDQIFDSIAAIDALMATLPEGA